MECAQVQKVLPAPVSVASPAQTQSELPAPAALLAVMWWLGRRLRQLEIGTGARAFARHLPVSEMPKKASGKGKSQDPAPPPPCRPVAVDPKGCVTIAIHAKPGARLNAISDLTAEAVSVAIAAPPTEGEANAELCRYLSKVLELRKSDVVLEKGGKSREKMVKLLAPTTPEEVLEKLKKQIEKE